MSVAQIMSLVMKENWTEDNFALYNNTRGRIVLEIILHLTAIFPYLFLYKIETKPGR